MKRFLYYVDRKHNYFINIYQRLYLIDVQSLHCIFDQLYVDLRLFWLELLVRNKLSFWTE